MYQQLIKQFNKLYDDGVFNYKFIDEKFNTWCDAYGFNERDYDMDYPMEFKEEFMMSIGCVQ